MCRGERLFALKTLVIEDIFYNTSEHIEQLIQSDYLRVERSGR